MLIAAGFSAMTSLASARSSASASTRALYPPAAIASGELTLSAKRASKGRLSVRVTATVTLKPGSGHRPLAADLTVNPCNAYINPMQTPFTGPTIDYVGESLDRQIKIPGVRASQRFVLHGAVSSNMPDGSGPFEDPNWTDCALAELDVAGTLVFQPDALTILTATDAAGTRVSYPLETQPHS